MSLLFFLDRGFGSLGAVVLGSIGALCLLL
jgi:hypothetical protein